MPEVFKVSISSTPFSHTIQDVDIASRSVSITKTISKTKDGTYAVSYTPKTEAGERVLPIPEFLVCVFQKAIDDYKPNKNQLLFTKPDGSLIKTHNSYDAFRRLCKKNGIQGKTQHGLRHTFATRSNEYNMNAKALSSMMGHKKTDITYDIYVDSDLNNMRLETDMLYEKMSSDFDLNIDIEP